MVTKERAHLTVDRDGRLPASNQKLRRRNQKKRFLVPLPDVGEGGVRGRSAGGGMDNNNLPAVWGAVGPGVSGAVFSVAWWFWVDVVVCSAAAIPFLHYLPGIALP